MLALIRAYWPEYRHYRGKLLLALAAMLMVAGATAAIAWMMKPLLDQVLIEKDTRLLYTLPVFVILAYLAKGLGSYAQIYAMNHVARTSCGACATGCSRTCCTWTWPSSIGTTRAS